MDQDGLTPTRRDPRIDPGGDRAAAAGDGACQRRLPHGPGRDWRACARPRTDLAAAGADGLVLGFLDAGRRPGRGRDACRLVGRRTCPGPVTAPSTMPATASRPGGAPGPARPRHRARRPGHRTASGPACRTSSATPPNRRAPRCILAGGGLRPDLVPALAAGGVTQFHSQPRAARRVLVRAGRRRPRADLAGPRRRRQAACRG